MTVAYLAALLAVPSGACAWGRAGHHIIVIVAEHYMRPETAAHMRELLAPESPEEPSAWADVIAPGILEAGDIEGVMGVLAPRPSLLEDLVVGRGRVIPDHDLRSQLAPLYKAYQAT